MDVYEPQGIRHAYYKAQDSPELVVALEHCDEVVRVLEQDLGVPTGHVDRSPDLGLALVRLEGSDEEAAEQVEARLAGKAEREKTQPAAQQAPVERSEPPRTAMDRLLRGLRTHFADEFAGWTPTIGKNRLVGHVEGGGHISHGGGSDPVLSAWVPDLRVARPGLGVRVGVLDTSVAEHEWLAGRWIGSPQDVLANQPPYPAIAGHGTFVTGLVLRMAPGCMIEARRVLSDADGQAESWDVAKAIVELGRAGIDVLNLSMVCYTEDGQPPLALAAAIDRLDPEIVVVAAAGNHGKTRRPLDHLTDQDLRKPAWPAALDDVIAVGAGDGRRDGAEAEFTPRRAPWIDVLADGVDVDSTYLYGSVLVDLTGRTKAEERFEGIARWSGSSFAAALVSGAIAARTVPGRTTARAAWEALLAEFPDRRVEALKGGRPQSPRFLPLLDRERAPEAVQSSSE
ncbi:S8 family peptidase [Geodermatophilus sp. SYSU D01186]